MANRQRVTSFRGSRGARRQTEWGICSVPAGFSIVGPGAKAIVLLVPAATLAPESPATIVRTRLVLSVGSDQVAASETQVGAFGCAFVNTVAATLGITGIPGPATDCAWGGWFVWQAFLNEFIQVTGSGHTSNAMNEHVIDSKSMRKFEEDEALVWMIENTHATESIRFAVAGRMLVKAG